MYIDAHVHLRNGKNNLDKTETVKHGLEVAGDSGLDAVFDMPNTDPPIMTRDLVVERLQLAKDAGVPEVFYGLYMGITSDPEQIKQAVSIYREFPQVIGMKLYAGHSVGSLGIINPEDQHKVYETLTTEGYDGVLAVHAEKESELFPNKWNPKKPITHCLARPEKSENDSVEEQIGLSYSTNFKGKLHIAHISSPRAVELVNIAKLQGLNISCEVCPHHFIFDDSKMFGDDGIQYKMNPPLRSSESREKIFSDLKEGRIDWIATDHAPHSLERKTQNPWMSGITGIQHWDLFAEYLRKHNFSDTQIEGLSFDNILRRFGLDISKSRRQIIDRKKDYPFNNYEEMERELSEK